MRRDRLHSHCCPLLSISIPFSPPSSLFLLYRLPKYMVPTATTSNMAATANIATATVDTEAPWGVWGAWASDCFPWQPSPQERVLGGTREDKSAKIGKELDRVSRRVKSVLHLLPRRRDECNQKRSDVFSANGMILTHDSVPWRHIYHQKRGGKWRRRP